jgi:hypothetical protein
MDDALTEAVGGSGAIQEAYGDVVEIGDSFFDQPGWGYRLRRGLYATTLWDRQDGRYRPVYETEIDLQIIRAMSWLLVARVPMARAWVERLTDYTIGTGFDWSVSHPSPEIKTYANRLIDDFMTSCGWSPGLERESFARSIEDGEFLGELVWDGAPGLVVREADELSEPLGRLDQYVLADFDPSWSFGVMTRPERPSMPLGYHFVRDEAGTDWNFAPAKRVLHWKRNVRSGAKRGVSDFYTPHQYLSRGDKILANTAEGTAVQAAIAYIVEHAPNVTGTQAAALTQMARVVGQNPVTGASQRILPMQGAQRLDVRNGQKYHAGPLAGTNNSQNYVAVMSAALRLAGSIKAFPEGMLTGDYGNNNYASAIVAQSPFVQGRLAEQATRAQEMREMVRKVLHLAVDAGKFRRFGINYMSDLEPGLEVNIVQPKVIPIDRLQLAQSLAVEKSQGWVTDQTAITELGRDYEQELNQRQDGPQAPVDVGAALAATPEPIPTEKVADTALNGAQVQAASQIVEKVAAGVLPRASGVAQLVMFFQLTQEQAEAVMATAGTVDFVPTGTTVALAPVPQTEQGATEEVDESGPSGEYAGLSRQQWNRNRKAIADVVSEFKQGDIDRSAAGVMLGLLGIASANVDALLGPAESVELEESTKTYKPPEGAQGNAKKVLAWREKHGDAVKGMTRVGWTRANQLASGEDLSRETVGRMAAFGRHRQNAEVDPQYKDEPWRDAGYVAWLGWGGDTGVNWASEIVKRESIETASGNLEESTAREVKILESWGEYP